MKDRKKINLKLSRKIIILSFIVLFITIFFSLVKKYNYEYKLKLNNFKNNNNIVGLKVADIKNIPRIPEGMKAVYLENGEYVELADPYSSQNIIKWGKEFKVQDQTKTIWKWIPKFYYNTEYYKDDQLLAIATAPEVYDANKKIIDGKTFENLIKDATHYKHNMSKTEKETFEMHPAFAKDSFISDGFWITDDLCGIEKSQIDTYGKLYDATYKNFNKVDNQLKINPENLEISIMNPREYGAINIFDKEILIKDNNNEVVLGFLENGNRTNGEEIISSYEARNIDNLIDIMKYQDFNKQTSEENFKELITYRSYFGDNITEARGLLNKNTGKISVDKSNFLTKEKPFLYLSKQNNNLQILPTDGDLQKLPDIKVRLVAFVKPLDNTKKISFTFNSGDGKLYNKEGKNIINQSFSKTKGAIISDEDMLNLGLQVKKEGYEFWGWTPDPIANIYYTNTIFEPILKPVGSKPTKAIARFYLGIEPNAKYIDVEGNVGETVDPAEVLKIKEQERNIKTWMPDPGVKILLEGTNEFFPIPLTGLEPKELNFTFYNGGEHDKEKKIVKKGYMYGDKGISPETFNLVPTESELQIITPNGEVFDGWNPDPKLFYSKDQEFRPKFIKEKQPETGDDVVPIIVNFNGSQHILTIKRYEIKKGSRLTDPENINIYERMTSDFHKKSNHKLPENKNDWFLPKLDTVINEETIFKMQWERIEINVNFWNAPLTYKDKKIIKTQKIYAGEKVELPEDTSELLPYYEYVGGEKRAFSERWEPEFVYNPIYANYIKPQADGTYVLDVYPVYKGEYDSTEKVRIKFLPNNIREEEIFYPAPEVFRERLVKKGSIINLPDKADYPMLLGERLVGFSPKLPIVANTNLNISMVWAKDTPVSPIENEQPINTNKPKPNTNNINNEYNPEYPKANQKPKENEQLIIEIPEEKPQDNRRNVNENTGLKENKTVYILFFVLFIISIFSYIKFKQMEKEEKKKNEFKIYS